MILRQFRESGVTAFQKWLKKCRDAPRSPLPSHLLHDDTLTATIPQSGEIDHNQLLTKADAASYLNSILGDIPEDDVAANAGLWTWLTLFFFDDVCPAKDGIRSVKNDYHYIFEPKNPRHFYRHLLFISWQIQRIAPKYNRLMLSSPLSSLDKVSTEIMKRLYLTRIPCVFEVLDRLYWDRNRQRPRTGIVSASMKQGDLIHRFPIRIRQLEKTYDLFSLNADQLVELLGEEFQYASQPKTSALQSA
jgi:hypothetical protein